MHAVSSIASALVDSGALKFGTYTIKSGVASPYYIDLTWLLSSPQAYCSVVDAVVEAIHNIPFSWANATISLKSAVEIMTANCPHHQLPFFDVV